MLFGDNWKIGPEYQSHWKMPNHKRWVKFYKKKKKEVKMLKKSAIEVNNMYKISLHINNYNIHWMWCRIQQQ